MATFQRPPTNPVVDAHRSSRWPIFLFVVVAVLAVGGGIAYDRYVANAPIVLTPTRPDGPVTKPRPGQPTSPSPQTTRPGQSKPTTSSSTQSWAMAIGFLIPIAFIAVVAVVIFMFVRRLRRAAMMNTLGGTGPVAGGPIGHWQGGQHVGTGGAAAGPWARQPGSASATPSVSQPEPVKRKGGGFPLLPIVVGAIILDQAVFNGRYSRDVLAWITKFIEGFSR